MCHLIYHLYLSYALFTFISIIVTATGFVVCIVCVLDIGNWTCTEFTLTGATDVLDHDMHSVILNMHEYLLGILR